MQWVPFPLVRCATLASRSNNPTQKAVIINHGTTQSLIISSVIKNGNSIIDTGNSVTIKKM
jgi:hypothetical protein